MFDATALGANERTSLEGKADPQAALWESPPRRAAPPRSRFMRQWTLDEAQVIKRGVDIFGSIILMILLAPVFALTAFLIKWSDGGPILFWQTRVGKRGREFAFPKFRSMRIDAEAVKPLLMRRRRDNITFKMKNDPRVTWIGRIIRRTSIDELPQLWCVLKGEMSLVGPRPPLPCEVEKYSLSDWRRLEITPGLTCIWQVSGRADIPFEQQVQLDVQYIESQNLFLDIVILLKTIPAVILGRGAY